MKHFLLTLLFISFSWYGKAQDPYPSIIWATAAFYAGQGTEESGMEFVDISVAAVTGDVYAMAILYAPCSFDGVNIIEPDVENGISMVLVKYNSQGVLQWVINLGYVGENPIDICTGNNGEVYLVAPLSVDEVNLGNGISVQRSCTDFCQEVFVARINGNGMPMWAKTITGGPSAYIEPAGIEINPVGAILVGGNYQGNTVSLGPGFEFNNLATGAFFLAAYSANNGTPQAAQFLAPDSDGAELQHLDIGQNGHIVLAGTFSGTLKFSNGVSISTTGFFDGFVAGLSSGGAGQWAKSVTSSDYIDILGIDVDNTGNAYLAIDASTDLRLNDALILPINSAYAGVVLKTGATLFSLPVVIEYNTDDYIIMDVELDHWGNIYTSGYTSESVSYGPSKPAMDGCVDGFITGTSSDGLPQWARTIGGAGCEGFVNNAYGAGIAIDDVGYMHCTGLFIQGFSEDGITYSNGGAFISKFNTSIVDAEEPASLIPMQIAPNPNSGRFIIQLASIPPANTEFLLYNMQGSLVYRQIVSAEQTEVQTDLPGGVYSAVLRNGARMERFKLIVQR